MAIVFDPAKSARNVWERGLSFERVNDFGFVTASYRVDDRHDYGELRIRALGFLDGRLHTLIFTERGEDTRVTSFRKANRAEMRDYAKAKS
jgi:uncharacterized protein